MKTALLFVVFITSNLCHAFCGFYVAKADAKLFNRASQVVIVNNDNKTAITMVSDYDGPLNEFALVVPVPEVLTREQINVGERALIEHLDAFSAPRLVEYFDEDPCAPPRKYKTMRAMSDGAGGSVKIDAKALGVKVEAQYTVGEYDISILSANDSAGLQSWLTSNGYKIPSGAEKALQPYIKQNMKFFVARVNLKEQEKTGFRFLRPLQFAFESPKFMLPIRLGMANSDGPQDLIIYAITKKGRVETTNYRTVKVPSEMDIPLYVKDRFKEFYTALFDRIHKREEERAVFLEYAWNMGWCDPCAADPLTPEELRKLGVFWLEDSTSAVPTSKPRSRVLLPQGGVSAFISRLHVRYDAKHFPEDLAFQETADESNFQGRYVLRHPFAGKMSCPAAEAYREQVKTRRHSEAETLASLTGWDLAKILKDSGTETPKIPPKKWFQRIFK